MKAFVVAILLVVVFVRCMNDFTQQSSQGTVDALTIRTGTSFGMCVGYCQNDYVFNGSSVTLAQSNSRPQAQVTPRSCQTTISLVDWNALKANADFDALSKQPKILGCPDCTDGGAEYIELQLDEQRYRVTFPFGKTIPGFESLVTGLRNQRNVFKDCQ